MSEAINKEKCRIISYDILRIVAILMVVIVHTVAPFMSYPVGSVEYAVANIINGCSRLGVPIFVMVSGALMLDENKNIAIKDILFKYVKNIFILLFSWAIIYSVFNNIFKPIVEKQSINWTIVFSDMLNGYVHLWFLFMIIGLYLITPILKCFVNKKNANYVAYFLVLAFIFCLLPKTIDVPLNFFGVGNNVISNYAQKFSLGFVLDCTIYYLFGWYAVHVGFTNKVKKVIYCLGVFCLVYGVLASQFFSTDMVKVSETVYNNLTINIFFCAIAVFILVTDKLKYKSFKQEALIVKLSNLTFGVYAVHVMVLNVISHVLLGRYFIIRIICGFVGTVIVSFIGAWIMSKIPVIKKIVRG